MLRQRNLNFGILHLMESVDIPCGKLRSLLSGHLVGDELTAFLGDKKTRERLILPCNVCRFLEKIGVGNFPLSLLTDISTNIFQQFIIFI